MPKVTVDFWDVIDEQGEPLDLLPIIQNVAALQFRQRMRDRGTEFTDYLAESNIAANSAGGTVARIRRHNWPDRVDLNSGELTLLELPPHQAIAEEMNFLYDQRLRVLATQRRRDFRAGMLVELLSEISGRAFAIQPKLREDAWRRFRRWRSIGSLELKLTTPTHHPDLSDTIPSMGELLDEAGERVHALEVELKLSMGRVRTRSLAVEIVRDVVNLFRGRANVQHLAARGIGPDDEHTSVVDFIRDRLVFSGQVEYTQNGRHLDRGQCQQLLRQSIETHRRHLENLL